MISLKAFVAAINEAIIQAGDSLREKNIGLLDRFFDETTDESGQKKLVPKTVLLEYPAVDQNLRAETRNIKVPLFTLVPLATSRIEKATLTADFEMELSDGDVQLDFASKSNGGLFGSSKNKIGRLEITVTPQDTPEGLKALLEAYERSVKSHLP